MIEKFAMAFIFVSLCIAVYLSLNGVTEINLSNQFYSLMLRIGENNGTLDIKIPDIPKIPDLEVGTFASGFFAFVNGLVTLLNILISLINVLIQVIMFIFNVITNFNEFKQSLVPSSSIALPLYV